MKRASMVLLALLVVFTAACDSLHEADPNDKLSDLFTGNGAKNFVLLNDASCPPNHLQQPDDNNPSLQYRCMTGPGVDVDGSVNVYYDSNGVLTIGRDNWLFGDGSDDAHDGTFTFTAHPHS